MKDSDGSIITAIIIITVTEELENFIIIDQTITAEIRGIIIIEQHQICIEGE
jgi:hypothetical protein